MSKPIIRAGCAYDEFPTNKSGELVAAIEAAGDLVHNFIQGHANPSHLRIEGASEEFRLIEAENDDGKPKLKKFSIVGYTGGLLRLEGWFYPVVVDLEGMSMPRQQIPALMSHDRSMIVGHTETIEKTAQRLKMSGVLSGYSSTEDTPCAQAAREIVRLAANGFEWQASIGASPDDVKFIPDGETFKANGRNFPGPLNAVLKSTLAEISFVAIGADQNTSANVAATAATHSNGATSMNPFDTWLTESGFDAVAVNASAKQKAKLEAQYNAEIQAANNTNANNSGGNQNQNGKPAKIEGQTTFDQKMEAIEEENRRIEYIRDVTAAHAASHIGNPEKVQQLRELCASAIEDKTMTIAKYDLALLRLDRSTAPMVIASKGVQLTDTIIEAGLCRYASYPDLEKRFKPEVLEATEKHFGRGGRLSLLDLIGKAARRNGWRGESVKSDLKRSLKAAFREDEFQDIRASVGPSTYSIPNILSNVANLHIRTAFESVEAEWRKIAFISSVDDYKEMTTVALTGDNVYKKVAPGGEVKHGKLGELAYANKADLFALLIGIDEQDLVNDSMKALTSASRRLGRGGAITMNQVFWAEWLDDAAFFPTDKSLANYDDGNVDSMLTEAGLDNMNAIFRAQTDPDGEPLGIRPRILLVPPTLEGAALRLMGSELTNLVTATTSTTGNTNIWRNRFTVVSSDYLTNPLAWNLLADPQDLPAIEMVFLNGQEQPQTETAEMAIDRLGIVIRGKHSFGARKQEHRAAVKAKGAT